MKVAVTARESAPESPVDERFGRAFWILIHDEQDGGWTAFDNSEARNAVQGAGIKAAQAIVDRKVDVLVTGVTGPKAFQALEQAGVAVYHGASGTVDAAVVQWRRGALQRADAASAVGRA